jgi:uncharacterized damage-inducible protein DinB
MGIREALLAEFDHEMASTRRVLACIPSDRLNWKPHAKSRSLGALAAHIAEITRWSAPIMELPRFDLDDAEPPAADPLTTADLMNRFSEETARARARLDRTDTELWEMWSLRQGGQELFSLPRAAAFRTFVLGHVVHHRGQLSVYLRLIDIAVPPIYGPTADSHRSEK